MTEANLFAAEAKEINERCERIDTIFAKADDHRIAAAIILVEVRKKLDALRAEDDSVPSWTAWCAANIKRSEGDIRKLIEIGRSPDPKAAVEEEREKNRRVRALKTNERASMRAVSPPPKELTEEHKKIAAQAARTPSRAPTVTPEPEPRAIPAPGAGAKPPLPLDVAGLDEEIAQRLFSVLAKRLGLAACIKVLVLALPPGAAWKLIQELEVALPEREAQPHSVEAVRAQPAPDPAPVAASEEDLLDLGPFRRDENNEAPFRDKPAAAAPGPEPHAADDYDELFSNRAAE